MRSHLKHHFHRNRRWGSHLTRHFQAARRVRGLSIAQLARLLGYTSVSKGCNRIRRFEERGEIHDQLFRKLAEALGIDGPTVERLIEQDRQDYIRRWNEWADQSIEPYLDIPIIPNARKVPYRREPLPHYIRDLAVAEKHASAIAWALHRCVCLQWSRRLAIWFDSTGAVSFRRYATPDNTPL